MDKHTASDKAMLTKTTTESMMPRPAGQASGSTQPNATPTPPGVIIATFISREFPLFFGKLNQRLLRGWADFHLIAFQIEEHQRNKDTAVCEKDRKF